ncbi:MAG: hypothetical protein ABGZ17_03575, partial [Planctomycetaceae bacterium]
SRCNWVVGECASKWTRKYARGRSDADFGNQVGLSADQVFQRRRVWETFGDVIDAYSQLKWSHFYVVINWDNAEECLQWAEENSATVAEMRAWGRAQRGEDLTQDAPPEDWMDAPAVSVTSTETTPVRDPAEFSDHSSGTSGTGSQTHPETVAGVARASEEGGGYAPFRSGAGHPPAAAQSESTNTAILERPDIHPEQMIKRMTTAIERINKSLTPESSKRLQDLPEKLRTRFVQAVSDLNTRVSQAAL